MARVVIAAAADADTDAIIHFLTTTAGVRTAPKYVRLFGRLFGLLAAQPGTGAPHPALGRHIRIGIALPYRFLSI